jgi:AraC-like DNA-binding protein
MLQQVSSTIRPLAFAQSGAETVLFASASTPWAGVQFEVHQTVPGELDEAGPPDGDHALVVILEGSVDMTVRNSSCQRSFHALPGGATFLGGTERASSRVTGSAKIAAVDLAPAWFHRVGLDRAPADFGRTAPLVADRTVYELMSTMCREVEAGARTGQLYGESLSVALLSYVLDRIPASERRSPGALSERQCRQLARYIRERLGDDLALGELAAYVGLGPRHFSDLFRRAFGTTPHRYLLNQRLDEGGRRLLASSAEIAEIALELGFSSQSHFATAFRKRFGVAPRQYVLRRRRPSVF